MSYLGTRNAVSIGVPQHMTLGGSNLLDTLSPSLLLQFAGAETLDSRVTFTRSTTATFTGSNGLIQSAAINAPRFTYDPTTLESLGLLIEEQRTNLVTYSEQFDNAAWTKSNATITANATTAPDGALTGDTLVENTATSTHQISQSISFTSGTSYSYTVFAKSDGTNRRLAIFTAAAAFGTGANDSFDLSTGTVAVNQSGGASIVNVGNGWYRCRTTRTATATVSSTFVLRLVNPSAADILSYTGDGTSGVFIWGAQLEAAAFSTSYIPTVASQVTRAADLASMTGTNFNSWYNATEGTFFVDGSTNRPYSASVGGQFLSPAADSSNRMWIAQGTTTNFVSVNGQSGGSGQWDFTVGGAPTSNQQTRAALAYAINNIAASANGSAVATDTSATIPSVTQLTIGIGVTLSAGSTINGTINKIVYYPRRLTNGELQAITS
jgi:hypothetical protein